MIRRQPISSRTATLFPFTTLCRSDTGGSAATTQGYLTQDRHFSHEVRLTSPSDGAFRWQVGVYYLNYRRFLTSELNADTQGFLPPTRGEIDGPTAAQPTDRKSTRLNSSH